MDKKALKKNFIKIAFEDELVKQAFLYDTKKDSIIFSSNYSLLYHPQTIDLLNYFHKNYCENIDSALVKNLIYGQYLIF